MKKIHVEWRTFCISIMIAITISYVIFWTSGLGFWLPFTLIVATMLLNGVLADWEDEQPGGFNNPRPPEADDRDKK